MVGEPEVTKLVGDVNSDVSVDSTGLGELATVLVPLGDSQCLACLFAFVKLYIVASVRGRQLGL